MLQFAFISRHVPTQAQVQLALEQGVEITHVGDMDAFSVTRDQVLAAFEAASHRKGVVVVDGVVVVHPAAAMRLSKDFAVGVYENAMRPADGGAPTFEAAAFHIYAGAEGRDMQICFCGGGENESQK